METLISTTPFGRRSASLGQIAAQIKLRDAIEAACAPGSNAPSAVNKWHLFRTLTGIRDRLGLSDRALSVLNALLSFHPETALTLNVDGKEVDSLVVYPSNRQLSLRAHGMAEVTIRRHIAALVEAGLILRRDSPNGKRYARRDEDGSTASVFGFDLTPLVARAVEFDAMADAAKHERRQAHLLRERITLHRRDIQKWLTLALDEELPGDWAPLRKRFLSLLTPLRSLRLPSNLTETEAGLSALAAEIVKLLESLHFSKIMSGNDEHTDRHMANSKTEDIIDSEPASNRGGGSSGAELVTIESAGTEVQEPTLALVLEACPDFREWEEGVAVRSWSLFSATAERIRPMLGISPDAWADARQALGARGACIALAFILQRSEHSSEASAGADGGRTVNGSPAIRSPGGYLRCLVEQARAGELRLGPLLMALIGQRVKRRKRAA